MAASPDNTNHLNMSMSPSTNVTYTLADLKAANEKLAITLIPAMLIFAVMMVIGLVGNSLVCYVFCWRLRASTQTYLIVYLAAFDLLSCGIGMPFEIAAMRHIMINDSLAACKTIRFINAFCIKGSTVTLLIIAGDRFRKVCRPLHRQLQPHQVKFLLVPIVFTALFLSWPVLLITGLRTTKSNVPGFPGTDCSTADEMVGTPFPKIYNSALMLAFIISAVSLAVIYTSVLRETKRRYRYMKRHSILNTPCSPCEESSNFQQAALTDDSSLSESAPPSNNFKLQRTQREGAPTNGNSTTTTTTGAKSDLSGQDSGLDEEKKKKMVSVESSSSENAIPSHDFEVQQTQEDGASTNGESPKTTTAKSDLSALDSGPGEETKKMVSDESSPSDNAPPSHDFKVQQTQEDGAPTNVNSPTKTTTGVTFDSSVQEEGKKKMDAKQRKGQSKTTIIAILVTVVFFLSCLPYLCIQAAKQAHPGHEYNLDGAGLVFHQLFVRSIFINSVANPIIYGVLNLRFRFEVKRLMNQCRACSGPLRLK